MEKTVHEFIASLHSTGRASRNTEISSTQVYLAGNMNKMREVYMRAHPRR